MACDFPPHSFLVVVSGMAFESKIARGPNIHNIYGLNTIQLTQDIERTISNKPLGLLSFGTAAGLAPALLPGTIVIAQHIYTEQTKFKADEAWQAELKRQLPEALCADSAGIDHPVTTPQDKLSLYQSTGAAIADMESHHVARLAERNNLPFAALRIVLDSADYTLPPAALAATRSDGGIDYAGLIGSLLTHPSQLPALMRLAIAQAKAKQSLLSCSHLLRSSLFGLANCR